MPSWNTVQHQLLIWTVTTAQCHDADLSTNQVHLTQPVSGDISAGCGILREFDFSIFRGKTFRNWQSQANFIFFMFFV